MSTDVCSVCCYPNPVNSAFMTDYWVCSKSNMRLSLEDEELFTLMHSQAQASGQLLATNRAICLKGNQINKSKMYL